MMTDDYYSSKLSSSQLKMCYDLAPPRTQQYLREEISFVLEHIRPSHHVIELGCGYGRVLGSLLERATKVVGIDTSLESLRHAREYIGTNNRLELVQMDAVCPAFNDKHFDVVVCIQNGISAFKREPLELIRQAVRITKSGGIVLFSSYSDRFWEHRIEWFMIQAEVGLLGEIDWERSKDGVIACKDGFRATTFNRKDFSDLASILDLDCQIMEIDESSLFCKISVSE